VVRAPARSAPKHEAQATVIVWGLMAATAAALIVGALVLRADVVRLWPQSSAAYAGLGLPVSGAGLAIEGVAAQPTFQGGRPVLTVSGRVRNLRHRDLSAPALRISLIDAAGHTVSMKIARPIDDSVPAGGQRYFAVAVVDPPSTARDLEVAFDGSGSRSISKNLPPSKPPAAPDATPLPTASPAVTPEHG
jgi:hypothetical protein